MKKPPVKQPIHPKIAAAAVTALHPKVTLKPGVVQTAVHIPKSLVAPPTVPTPPVGGGPNAGIAYQAGPYVAPGGVNPYTGAPMSSGQYVGVAGSELDHPGLERIPPPGWEDPTSPYYERRDYTIGPDGVPIANEAGFQASSDHPYNTGRIGEVNSEFSSRPGYSQVHMSQPGVTTWGPGQDNPNKTGGGINADWLKGILGGLKNDGWDWLRHALAQR